VRIGARALAQRLFDPGLSPSERAFLEQIEPAFSELVSSDEQHIYVGGTSRLLAEMRWADMSEINNLMHALEERVTLLGVLRGALDSDSVFLRIGSEHEVANLRGVSLVAANYGLVTRNLGTVSLIGPTRMDYAAAIRGVRGAAALLSDYVESVYEQ
jgi:heat-inducible transcriptional repressor